MIVHKGCAVEKADYKVLSVCGGCLTTTVTVQNTALAARLGPNMLRRAGPLTPHSKLLESYPLHFKPRPAGEVSSRTQASAHLTWNPNVAQDACRVSASQAAVQKQGAREVTHVPTAVFHPRSLFARRRMASTGSAAANPPRTPEALQKQLELLKVGRWPPSRELLQYSEPRCSGSAALSRRWSSAR